MTIVTPVGSIESDSGNHIMDILSVVFVIGFFVLIKKVIMDKTKGIYQEELIVGVDYTYNKDYKKIYDIKSLKRRLQEILKNYK